MGSIRATGTKLLFLDFRFKGQRCREYTALEDTPANRKRLGKMLKLIEAQIEAGKFNYREHFPDSRLAARLDHPGVTHYIPVINVAGNVAPGLTYPQAGNTPRFSDFADQWFAENEIRWRRTYRRTIEDIIKGRLRPTFGGKEVGQISKADILQFRSTLGKVQIRKSGKTLSAARINYVMMVLRQILTEAADRFNFTNPYRNIKPVKLRKTDIEPFSLQEVQTILARVRPDYRAYYTVRFFTGMRTGEVDGLKWKYVDFEHRLILVRETIVNGIEEYTKTDGSQRDIQMSQVVFNALKEQEKATREKSEYVFCNQQGKPLNHNNVTNRVWYPLLRYLGLKVRRPYQTRHTCATLWLASGENPEWVARQLGHTSTEMLFKVYSRYVPNLTRQDGSAFERLLTGVMGNPMAAQQDKKEASHV
ncbi:site-specific integrase [Betaproteobacteria bacterium SCN2]|jgi:integrase|nr:site-specific integrase [Betaproteobacteria bacterium SCN2]